MQQYVFGYGSLMNPKSLARTIPGERAVVHGSVRGYRRKMNVPYGSYLYLNLVPFDDSLVQGVLVPVDEAELELLKRREREYACVDITAQTDAVSDCIVYAFIAPDHTYPHLKIPRSYINTCLAGVAPETRESWLRETIMDNEIEDDMAAPVYENVPVE